MSGISSSVLEMAHGHGPFLCARFPAHLALLACAISSTGVCWFSRTGCAGFPARDSVFEFGGVDTLTPADLADLHQAVDSLLRAKRAKDAVPYKRDAREWLACIRARRASKPEAAPTLGAVLKGAAHV